MTKLVGDPVLAVGLGRGGSGKSTLLLELYQRAAAQGRSVLVADGDARSKTLAGMFPDAMVPQSEEMPDVKALLTQLLNRVAKEKVSAILDLGGGDRALLEFGRDLRLVEFCQRRGITPLALYCLGPDEEDLSHVATIFEGGYFQPERMILVLNEGVIRSGQHVAGAFERTLRDARFARMIEAGAKPILLQRLACMAQVRNTASGFYGAAAGEEGLDPVEEFQTGDWLEDLEAKRVKAGCVSWLP